MSMMILLALVLLNSSFCKASLSAVELGVGEQKIVNVSSTSGVVITNPKIAKLVLKGTKINIIAKLAGVGEIRAGSTHIRLTVFSQKIAELKKELAPRLRKIYGVNVSTRFDKIIFKGTCHRLQDWVDLQRLHSNYGKLISNQVELSPELLPQLEAAVDKTLNERAFFAAHTRVHQGHIQLLTYTKNKGEISALQNIAEEWGVDLSTSSQAIELKPMIEIEVVIAEIKKNSMENLGLQLPGTYSATIIPAGDLSSATNTFNGITPQLNAIFSNGMNKVLANPKLLCRSGEVAHFVAGGEIPIKIMNWKTSDVIWKRYGVILDITPLADLNQGISTKLVTEISLLDEAHTVDHIPGLLTNRIETHFDLRGSKTIALSGLIKSEIGRGTTGTPLLGQIPILGALFRSKNYQDNRTELVVFVTPRVISPENPPEAKIPNFWQDPANEF
jgi:pilus assembly protein CpaC